MPDGRSSSYPARDYLVAAGNTTSSGDTTVITARAGYRVKIVGLFVVNNDDADIDVSIQEAGTATNTWPKTHLPAFGGQLDPRIPGQGIPMPSKGVDVDLTLANGGASPDVSYVIFYEFFDA